MLDWDWLKRLLCEDVDPRCYTSIGDPPTKDRGEIRLRDEQDARIEHLHLSMIGLEKMPRGSCFIVPCRKPYETDEELARRCVLVKNLGES